MNEKLVAWLSWRGLRWNRLNAVRRSRELQSMGEYYSQNPPVQPRLKKKYRTY